MCVAVCVTIDAILLYVANNKRTVRYLIAVYDRQSNVILLNIYLFIINIYICIVCVMSIIIYFVGCNMLYGMYHYTRHEPLLCYGVAVTQTFFALSTYDMPVSYGL